MFRSTAVIVFVASAVFVATAWSSTPPFMLEADQRGFPAQELKPGLNRHLKSRLPTNVVPVNYQLDITPVLDTGAEYEQFKAPGKVIVTVECLAVTRSVTLHSAGTTEITNVEATLLEGEDFPVETTERPDGTDNLVITFSQDLAVGSNYLITIKFVSVMNENEDGLYRSFYDIETFTGVQRRYIATTQFETLGARMAFPCFDEPALRATFDIRIGRKDVSLYHSLSNMPLADTIPVPVEGLNGYIYETFEQTPKMSTYLIAIIVSDFNEAISKDNPNVKSWGPENRIGDVDIPGDVSYGQFSADVASQLLTFYRDYFNGPDVPEDPMPKLDSAAVPHFAPGAMENWGMNIYRIPTLLFVHGDMTQFELWRQAAVISHEIAHQWFGNLVTVEWWNHLWLKEGFARYLQFIGVEGADTDEGVEFDPLKRVVLDTIQLAMDFDVGPDTHPLLGESEDTVEPQYSRIIYEKGASIIRMMEGFLNEQNEPIDPNGGTTLLQRALRRYLAAHQFSSAKQDDLFAAIQAELDTLATPLLHKPIAEIMESWTTQVGFPLVRVSRVGRTRIYASQEQYVVDPVARQDSTTTTNTYEIPVSFISEHPDEKSYRPKPEAWISTHEAMASIPVTNSETWILVNPEAKGYYRVLYDDHLFTLLKAQLGVRPSPIPTTSRSQLFDDYFNFAFHSYAPISKALELTEYWGEAVDEELAVWTTALTHLRKVYNYLRSADTEASGTFELLHNYLATKIQWQFNRMVAEFPESGPITYTKVEMMLLALLTDWGCVLQLDGCSTLTTNVVEEWGVNPVEKTYLVADLQPIVLCQAYQTGDAPWIATIHAEYDAALLVPTNHNKWLYVARGCTTVEDLPAVLQETINPESSVPKDHRIALIQQIAGTPEAKEITFVFLEAHTIEIINRIGDDAISTAISALSVHTSLEADQQRLRAYLATNEGGFSAGVVVSINNSIAAIQKNREWSAEFGPEIQCYFAPTTPGCSPA